MLCAYEAFHADERPITDAMGKPFRSTHYTTVETHARAHNGHVKQIGASHYPPTGVTAEVLSEDAARNITEAARPAAAAVLAEPPVVAPATTDPKPSRRKPTAEGAQPRAPRPRKAKPPAPAVPVPADGVSA